MRPYKSFQHSDEEQKRLKRSTFALMSEFTPDKCWRNNDLYQLKVISKGTYEI
jgi:hypothetical protein